MARLLALLACLLLVPYAPAAAEIPYEHRVQWRLNQHRDFVHEENRLRPGACVDAYAEQWASHLAATGGFYHSDMAALLDACDTTMAGEILARGDITPWQARRLWVDSPDHHDVMTNGGYRHIGVAAVVDDQGRTVVVVNFVR